MDLAIRQMAHVISRIQRQRTILSHFGFFSIHLQYPIFVLLPRTIILNQPFCLRKCVNNFHDRQKSESESGKNVISRPKKKGFLRELSLLTPLQRKAFPLRRVPIICLRFRRYIPSLPSYPLRRRRFHRHRYRRR